MCNASGGTTVVQTISRDALKAALDQGEPLVLLEALPPMYFDDAHLPGARNMPHDQVDQLAADLIPSKDALVVVYCANLPCQNSVVAAKRLAALGYTNVREYAEGKQDWIEAGLPIERAAAAPAR